MAGPEATFYQWLAVKLNEFGCQHWDRIESSTSKGIPDLDICHNGRCTKIELKYEAGNQVKIRPEQRNWINKRIKSGGRVFILVKRVTAKVNQIELYEGFCADQLFRKQRIEPMLTAIKTGTGYCKESMKKILQTIL